MLAGSLPRLTFMKIYYVCPDLPAPSGGIKRLYQHVEILNNAGFNSCILHFKKNFKPNWFLSNAPAAYMEENPAFSPNDIFVFPEGLATVMSKFIRFPCKKVVIALSHSYIFQNMPLGENWNNYGITAVITPSKIIKDLISWSMNIKDVVQIGTTIDSHLFNYVPEMKTLQVAYIKRKDTSAEIVEKILKSKRIDFKNILFNKIENLPINVYAETLKSSEIFISTSPLEGINRSVLEAMACGCICIGYDGLGSREYIVESGTEQNFIVIENMNYIELAKKLEEVIDLISNESCIINKIRKNAISAAGKFTGNSEQESVIKFWKEFISI